MQFDLSLAIEFRSIGADVWQSGYTEKIGSNRIQFRSLEPVPPSSEIEMVFHMPVADPCRVECIGKVLEVCSPNKIGAPLVISASIERYSFVR